MAKLLVTGGAGFIGSALIHALNCQGRDDILVTDTLGHGDKFKNLVPLRFEDYIEADALFDLLDADDAAVANITHVFHLGANSSTVETDCSHLIRNNYEYTKRLAEWALSRLARFVYASSAATYGDGSRGMDDRAADLHSLRPLNMYGYSKHLFDSFAQRKGWLDRIVGLKYFNVFGPNENHTGEMMSLVQKAYHQVVDTGVIRLFKSHNPDYEDGKQMRDFLYVKDAVAMTLHLGFETKTCGLFNLGSGIANTWLTLAESIFAALGKPPNIEFIDMPEKLRGKYQYYTCADISKLRETGYEREVTPLPDAVADYVKTYLVPDRHLGDEPQ